MPQPRTIVVSGATGLIGSRLVDALVDRGDSVIRLVRQETLRQHKTVVPAGVRDEVWDPRQGVLNPRVLEGVDGIVNLAGASIGDRRWTTEYKEEILASRVAATHTITQALLKTEEPAKVFLSGSASGFYGFPSHRVDETSPAGDTYLAHVCELWEQAARPAMARGTRLTSLRTGIVLSPHGGALKKLLLPLRFGVGGPLGSGDQVWSWITLDDHIRALLFLLDDSRGWGPVNLVAPQAATNKEITQACARALHRPSFMKVPGFALRMVLGEFADEILQGVEITPSVLVELGFRFNHATVADAVQWAFTNQSG
ncbi:TIGR01777 family oxidoreductase [Timonella sp. A28]|uniref:TIGR01777 family oxidoreductase n=1 Tax=Timonella sp. A28 TaxID=3442640 RepID=UPI003EB84067